MGENIKITIFNHKIFAVLNIYLNFAFNITNVLINSKITFSIFFKGYVRATFAVKIMKYGYARVSTPDQCLNLQLDALRLYGVDHICEEKISGKNKNKPVLDALIAKLKTGDQLIVWKLDRLGRRTLL